MFGQGLEAKETQEQVNAHFRRKKVNPDEGAILDKICDQAEYAHTLLIRSIMEHLHNGSRVLDLGAGFGRLSAQILKANRKRSTNQFGRDYLPGAVHRSGKNCSI